MHSWKMLTEMFNGFIPADVSAILPSLELRKGEKNSYVVSFSLLSPTSSIEWVSSYDIAHKSRSTCASVLYFSARHCEKACVKTLEKMLGIRERRVAYSPLWCSNHPVEAFSYFFLIDRLHSPRPRLCHCSLLSSSHIVNARHLSTNASWPFLFSPISSLISRACVFIHFC